MEFIISCSKVFPYLGRCFGGFRDVEARLPRVSRCSEQLRSLKEELYDRVNDTDRRKLDITQRLLKIIKTQCQDYKLTAQQTDDLFESCFATIEENLRHLENHYYKEQRTDCESALYKRSVTHAPLIQQMPIPTRKDPPVEIYQLCIRNVNFQWQFQTVQDLCDIGSHIFSQLPLAVHLNLTKAQLYNFLSDFSKQYNVVPFHNFTHAFTVMMMFYQMHEKSGLKEFVNQFQVFFALVACLGHDVGHEGLNNGYYVKNKSAVALDYSYIGVLEQMHLSRTMRFLATKAGYLMNGLTMAERDRARKIISKAILATDMAKHFKYVYQLRDRTGNHLPICAKLPGSTFKSVQALSKDRQADHQFLIEIFVHACDIGNPILNFDNYLHWANMVCLQFNDQTIRQNKDGLQITNFLRYSNAGNYYRNQITFTNSVVLPLWTQISNLFQQLRQYRQQIIRNIRQIEDYSKRKANDFSLDQTIDL